MFAAFTAHCCRKFTCSLLVLLWVLSGSAIATASTLSNSSSPQAVTLSSNATNPDKPVLENHNLSGKYSPDNYDGALVGHSPEEEASYATELPGETLTPNDTMGASPNSATGTCTTCPPETAGTPETHGLLTNSSKPAFAPAAGGLNSTNATIAPAAEAPLKIIPPRGLQPTALKMFRLIPPSIFDNTIEGLMENEKQTLADTGETEFWVMTALSDEEVVVSTKSPQADTQATLKLFRAKNSDTYIVIGVTAGDACALEIWKHDSKGRITPMAMPDEPPISDFFASKHTLPKDTDVSMLLCLDSVAEGLEAKPLIWTPYGLDSIKLDNRVFYIWNGAEFVKKIVPLKK